MPTNLNSQIGDMYEEPKKADNNFDSNVDQTQYPTVDASAEVINIQKSDKSSSSKLKTKISEFGRNYKADIKYLLLIVPIVASYLVVSLMRNNQTLGVQAGVHQASLSFQLASWNLPPKSTFGVWVNSDSPVAFSDIELTFDPKVVKLASEVSLKNSLTRKIKVTSMAEANSTGRISIIVGLDPTMRANAPTGAFQIADLVFDSNTAALDATSKISFVNSAMQLVALDQSVFGLTTTGIDLTVNKTNPTPTSTASATVLPTTTPVVTNSPTPVPTIKVTATPTTVPTYTSIPSETTFTATGIKATDVTQTSATINWNLSDYGTGQVKYGPTTAYQLLSKLENSFSWNYHLQTLTNLTPNTLYHYRVMSTNKAGQTVVSDDYTFTTLSSTSTGTTTTTSTTQNTVLLSGTVVNSYNNKLISRLDVSVKNSANKVVAKGKTDTNGHYGFYLVPGTYKVTVSGFGYNGKTISVNLLANYILNFAITRWSFLN